MKSKIEQLIVSSGVLAIATPFMAFAQSTGNFTYSNSVFAKIIQLVKDIITAIMPVITAGLVIYFAWEVFQFMKGEGQEKGIHKSRMINALIALFIWFVFFGIIQVVANSFGLGIGDKINKDSDITVVDFN